MELEASGVELVESFVEEVEESEEEDENENSGMSIIEEEEEEEIEENNLEGQSGQSHDESTEAESSEEESEEEESSSAEESEIENNKSELTLSEIAKNDEIPSHLKNNPFLKQLHQILELKSLHKQAHHSRLSWAQGGEDRLKKAEKKVVHFLDESVREASNEDSAILARPSHKSNEPNAADNNTNCRILEDSRQADADDQEEEMNSAIILDNSQPRNNEPCENAPKEVVKRAFLKRGTGLRRFYKEGAADGSAPSIASNKRPLKSSQIISAVDDRPKGQVATKAVLTKVKEKKLPSNIHTGASGVVRNGSGSNVESQRHLKSKTTNSEHQLGQRMGQRSDHHQPSDLTVQGRRRKRSVPNVTNSVNNSSNAIIDVEGKEDFQEIDELQELMIFETMERITGRSSFGSTSSWIDKFVNNKLNLEDSSSENINRGLHTLSTNSQHQELNEHIEAEVIKNHKEAESLLMPNPNDDQLIEESEIEDVPAIPFRSLTNYLENMLNSHTRDDISSKLINDDDIDIENVKPEYLSAAVMTHLHKKDRRIAEMKNESHLMNQMRARLENLELSLKLEKSEFETYKKKEQSKLDKYKANLDAQGKSMEKMSEEREKLRELNINYQEKINALNAKIDTLEAEWKRKSNRWDMTNKMQQERIETLEKLNKNLEADKAEWITSKTSEKSSDLLTNSKKKIHFAEDNPVSVKSRPSFSQNQKYSNSYNSANSSTGYFPKSLKANKSSDKDGFPSRSSMKPAAPSKAGINIVNQSVNAQTPSLPMTLRPPVLTDTNLSKEWNAANESNAIANTGDISKLDENVEGSKSYTYTNSEGDLEKVYSNGTRKYVSKSRNFVRLIYANGDIKEIRPDGSIQYFYSELGIRQYTYPNGLEMTSYANGQTERRNADGTTEVLFPNGCVKFIRSDGKEEFIFPDNTVYQVDPNGEKIMHLPNGQKEIHTDTYKKRIYPDGTTRTIYENGTFETVYPDSRIRLKDMAGNLLSDTIVKDGIRVPFC